MAKKAARRNGESVSAYFKKVFAEHPDWLALDTTEPIRSQWKQERGQDMDKKTSQIMANVKSRLRRKPGGKGGKPGPKKGARKPDAVSPKQSIPDLERLEVMIDNCLSTARALNVQNIDLVVGPLRQARNNIVLMFTSRR